ncbi:hypothetical protein FIBSPDRAFT_1054698 [Athelia psychrophila]|uniref:Uncharacterized protein n=1 Tax=Athelia psychrophila TaxID=1759441 RepID=A0A167UXG6_9AGAM|nr:hypothetical protein FIBSPDRAFT_1054698 [Fibularhizoctonia sp. CBS 109695]
MAAVTVSGSAGVALAYLTTGISLIGTAYSIRQFHILFQQMRIIEENLEKREHKDMPKKRLKDIIIGMSMGAAAYAAGFGVAIGLEHLVAPLMDGLSTASASILQSQLSAAATDIHVTGFTHVAGAATVSHHFSLHHFAREFGHAIHHTAHQAGAVIHHAAHEVHTIAHDAKGAIRLAAHEVHVVAHDAKTAIHHIAEELSAVVHHPHDAEHGLAEGLRESVGMFHGGAVAPCTSGGLADVTSQILAISIAHTGEHMLVAQFVAFAGERLARIEMSGKGEEVVAEVKVNTAMEKKLPLKKKKLEGDVDIVEIMDPPPCNCETRGVR